NSGISSLALQADGKILIASGVGTPLRRLNSDGSRDTNFSVQITYTTPSVNSLAIQADGKIILAGAFSAINGQYRTNIGRLNNNSSAPQDLSFDGSTIVWLRGVTSPEAWRTTFHASTDGTDWSSLGRGMRMPGGWQAGIV